MQMDIVTEDNISAQKKNIKKFCITLSMIYRPVLNMQIWKNLFSATFKRPIPPFINIQKMFNEDIRDKKRIGRGSFNKRGKGVKQDIELFSFVERHFHHHGF